MADKRRPVTPRYLDKLRYLNVGWSYRDERVRLPFRLDKFRPLSDVKIG